MSLISVISGSGRSVPGAPTIGTATNLGTGRAYNNGAATVTFTAGAGAAATSFTATSSPGGFTATGASSPLTVTGLQSSTSYTFTVTATNASGTSAASSASNSITATTVPAAPTIGTATGGNASATVAYTAGATGGATITTFTATSSPGSFTGTGASPITVSGLTNGTAYTFTVTATNANGTSTASAASNSVTPVVPSSFDSIATITATGSSTLITFSGIPSTYKDLQVRVVLRGSAGSGFNTNDTYMYFNGDSSSANYYTQNLRDTGTAGFSQNQIRVGFSNGPIDTTTTAPIMINFYDYKNTSKRKSVTVHSGVNNLGGAQSTTVQTGAWTGTAAINSISFTAGPNFPSGSIFSLYGIAG
jgi:hypothetical protein